MGKISKIQLSLFFFLLLTLDLAGQCIQATGNTTTTIPLLSSITNPAAAYDQNDGDATTAATLTVNGVGVATLNVNFDDSANPGDSIIVLFGVPTANILDWGSLGGTTFTPYSGLNGTGSASTPVTAANLSFIITAGANSLARIAIPVTSLSGARSVRISYLGIGVALNKRTFIYDVSVKNGPVVVSANQAVCSPGGSATFTGTYNALGSTPIDVIWYGPDGTTVLQTDDNRTGIPYTSTFTTPFVTTTTTFYVRERWAGCTLLSDPRPVTITVRAPLVPDISVTCGNPVSLSVTTSGSSGNETYNWLALNGGNIVSGANTGNPVIDRPGDYQVTVSDANGCSGTTTERVTASHCAQLPVKLVSFHAKKEENAVVVEWRTASETNSDRYEIERSIDGKAWNVIGTVTSQNDESESVKNYLFTDINPNAGENLYRLKMVDRDGTFALSVIRSVFIENSGLTVYPNPASGVFYIKDPEAARVKKISIFNAKGQLVYTGDSVPSSGINVKGLSGGIHTVWIEHAGGAKKSLKVILYR
ncbi:T9SS type A sorting domain-containing protein [Dyadobacter aurulentus]|uniref:T9SS type A sorting domain-containing protein n=1 Tax=Dyadobacter sp. UC 10 TaxID=2605428 RepID=UPI0011F0C097|nr:T9SS type A sorting domain-containing protein [Dyadobacter sp. UC 10]KAA0993510.1 T9SS type A sorting domain-containing protein [Dyadobacter sp. UC 10]